MKLSLDSSVLVEILRGRAPLYRERIGAASSSGDSLFVSAIVLHELAYGAMISARPEHHLKLIETLVSDMDVQAVDEDDVLAAAQLRAELRRMGEPLTGLDPLIVGQALNRGWTVVTANVRHFARIPGLSVIDWSEPA